MERNVGLLGAVIYKPGISFRNAGLARPATIVRKNPWFYQKMTGGPMTKRAKLRRWKSGKMARYRAVWNRGARQAGADKLGLSLGEVPNYMEIGLGEIPGPTAKQNTMNRGPLGFLENILSTGMTGADQYLKIVRQREQERTQMALAKIKTYKEATEPGYATAGMFGGTTPLVIGTGVAAVVIVAMLAGKGK